MSPYVISRSAVLAIHATPTDALVKRLDDLRQIPRPDPMHTAIIAAVETELDACGFDAS
jgi:hypothetical protein